MVEAANPDETALKQAMGRAIAHARVAAGFTSQAAFSRAIDVRFQYMSRVERGEENLTLETLAKMTGVLRVSMPDFLNSVAKELSNPSDPPKTRRGRPPAA
jgi:transcriptional regulator with XRE-family HTH domain